MTYDLNFVFFFIQSPSISLNKTVVIKTMISDKTVFHFQHCDHQLTLVIIVQLPRLPVVSLRLGLISVLGKHHCLRLDEKKIEIICHTSSPLFLDIARCVFSLRHKSPAWQGQRSVQDRLCSKQMHPFMHTDFPLQVQTRSCKKSEDIWPLK
jgi:hypothetical protein